MRRKFGISKSLMLAAGLAPLGLTGALAQSANSNVVALPEVDVISTTPLAGGGGQDIYSFPSMVQTVTPQEFARTRSPNVTDALQQYVPGVFVDDINGNPFSQELQYRGFYASPQEGTPQGLAVYQNGMRINEPFRRHRQLGSDPAAGDRTHGRFHRQSDLRPQRARRRDQHRDEERIQLARHRGANSGRLLWPRRRLFPIWQAGR